MNTDPNPLKREDENNADNELRKKVLPADDSIKTPPRKNRLGWEQPQDEQMYGSFDELREQLGGQGEAE